MRKPFQRLRRFLRELKRRNVYRVAGTYLVAAFVVLQLAGLAADAFGFPGWFEPMVWVLAGLGLPLSLVVAWAFEVTPEGVRQTPEREAEGEPASARSDGSWAAVWSVAAIALLLAGASVWYVATRTGGARSSRSAPGSEATGAIPSDSASPEDRSEASAFRGQGAEGAGRSWLSVATEPSGAEIAVTPVRPVESFANRRPAVSGRTPYEVRLPAAEYHVRIQLERSNPVNMLVHPERDDTLRLRRRLVPAGQLTAGMVRVESGPSPAGAAPGPEEARSGEPPPVESFLVDRHEVTNQAFLAFVSGGGYEDPSVWPDTLRLNGERVAWREGVRRLTGRSGTTGPRGWSGGLYPDGTGEEPVTGVTWYEARAYCRWVDKRLPSWTQWWRAALGDTTRTYPWGDSEEGLEVRANFHLAGVRPVGSFPLGASPYGALDMVGNVREWIRGRDRVQGRLVVGGSYQDPLYMALPSQAESFPPGFADETVGFRCVKPLREGGGDPLGVRRDTGG